MLFKGLALFFYLFLDTVVSNFILVFVACVLALAFDFWTVKNITGRLLVGLRWWNEIKEDGTNEWKFESKPSDRQVHPTDLLLFWSALVVTPLVWMMLGITSVIKFQLRWLLIVAVAVLLSGANVVGYWKCQKDAKAKLSSMTSQFLVRQLAK